MFCSRRMHCYHQRILWVVFSVSLLIQSTAFALSVLPETVLSNNPEALFSNSLSENSAFKAEPQPASIIGTSGSLYQDTLPISDLRNEAFMETSVPQNNNILEADDGNVAKEVEIPSVENRITFLRSGMKIENQPVTGEDIEGETLNRIGFIMTFGDISEIKEYKESAADEVLNWFYEFLQQFTSDRKIEASEINPPISQEPVTEEQLKIWLQNVIAKEEALFKEDVLNKSTNEIHDWSSTMLFPTRNKTIEAELEIDSRSALTVTNKNGNPRLKNYNYDFCPNVYPSPQKSLSQYSSGYSDRPNQKGQNSYKKDSEESFVIRFIDYILNAIQSFKIWLDELFAY